MSRIALIADIHGNVPALEAADADIRRRNVDEVYCLGDMCGRGPNGSAAVDYCRRNCEVVLAGNWDCHVISGARQDYLAEIGEERRAYLASLPLSHKLWVSGRRMHMLHGRPLKREIV